MMIQSHPCKKQLSDTGPPSPPQDDAVEPGSPSGLVVIPQNMLYIATHGDEVHELCTKAGFEIYEPERRGRMHRRIYLSPHFVEWFSTDMRRITPTPTQASIASQAKAEFEGFVAGEVLTVAADFHCLRDVRHGVWELKTPDIRFFGWFFCKNCLILHEGGDANYLHGRPGEDRHAPHVDRVAAFRDACTSLPPYLKGVRASDVVSNRIR